MKPPRFDYVRAGTLAEAHAVLAQEGDDASVLAGGQTLIPLLSMRMAAPRVLVDIMPIAELRGITQQDDTIRVGAGVRQAELLAWPGLATAQPLLAQALPWLGHAQTRARGTVCGSIALADPSAELPLALLALGGAVLLSSATGARRMPAADFFTGLMSTARRDDELVEAALFPSRRPATGYAFREFARRHGDFAIVACAAVAAADGTRLAVAGVADTPAACHVGQLAGAALDEALAEFADGLDARDDLHATADYRRALVRRLGRAVIEEARRSASSAAAASKTPAQDTPPVEAARRQRPSPDRLRASGLAVSEKAGDTPMRLSADARHPVAFKLNGRCVRGDAEPRMLLTDFLRQVLGMTGTHVGCEHGVCGACTIQIDGVPARACLGLAVQNEGAELRTVEGLEPAPGRLSALQDAFRRHFALQCGFCTPGILMSLDWFLRQRPDPTEPELREFLGGHLCRCTGYVPIVAAALDAAARLREGPRNV